MTAFLDPPPTLQERARAFIDVVYDRPLRREDYSNPAAAKRAIWLRGWALSKFVRNLPGFRLIGAFHDALRQGNLTTAHDLLKQFEEEARFIHPNWNWKPHVALMARRLDAAEKGQASEEYPVEVDLLVAYWMHETSDVAEVLTEFGFNRRALRRQECKVAQDTFRATEEAGEALIDHILRAGLHLAQKDVPPDALRTEPLRDVAQKVRGRQRKEVLQELPQAIMDGVKPRDQRKLGFQPYAPAIHDAPLREHSTTSNVLGECLSAVLPSLSPAERRAVLEALEAARQDVPLPRYWGDAYQRKIKALKRASKRIQGMGSAS